MKKQMLAVALLMGFGLMHACPVTIVNDQPADIMVIDPHTGKEIHIKGKSWLGVKSEGTIEPKQGTITKWFVNKRLVIKVKNNDGIYYPMYEVKQRKCSTSGKIMLTVSDIKALVKKPTDLLEATEVSAAAQASSYAKPFDQRSGLKAADKNKVSPAAQAAANASSSYAKASADRAKKVVRTKTTKKSWYQGWFTKEQPEQKYFEQEQQDPENWE